MRNESDSNADPIAAILAELDRYESAGGSIDTVFERWSFAISALLIVAKVALTIAHTIDPIEHGLSAILFLGAAVIATAVLGQLPTLARLLGQAIAPGSPRPTRDAQVSRKRKLLLELEAHPPDEIARARFLIESQGADIHSRLDFLVGPVARLGIIPAIVMLLTSFSRMGSTVADGPMTLDAVHYATVLTFVLYFAAAIADSLNRRLAFHEDVLSRAASSPRNEPPPGGSSR